jgi:tRNA(Arg) A34 adenosine deaminase TadA
MSLIIKCKIRTIYYGAPLDAGNDLQISAKEIVKNASYPLAILEGILEDECKALIYSQRQEEFVS